MKKTIYVSVFSNYDSRYFTDGTHLMVEEMSRETSNSIRYEQTYHNKEELLNLKPEHDREGYRVLISDNEKIKIDEWDEIAKLRKKGIFSHIVIFAALRDNFRSYHWVYELNPDAVISCEYGKDRLKSTLEAMCYYDQRSVSEKIKERADKIKDRIEIDEKGKKKLFSDDEITLLQGYADNLESNQIKEILGITSKSTFYALRERVFEKIGIDSVGAATLRVFDWGLIKIHPVKRRNRR